MVSRYSSWFVIQTTQHDPRATLLYPLMRLQGIHVIDGFCCFMTTEHGQAECDRIADAFEHALKALQAVGILAPQQDVVADPVNVPPVAKSAPAGPVPLTESLREIWMTHQLGDLPAASFNESTSVRLSGSLNVTALHDALEALIARHDALRNLLRQDAASPLDIVAGAPIRMQLARLSDTEHVLILTAHHIACDGWFYNTLLTELAALYTAQTTGQSADLPPAPSFSAYAIDRQTQGTDDQTRDFWQGVYKTIPELLDLPTDRPRAEVKSFPGATATAHIGIDVLKPARLAGAKNGCTLFGALFAALQITLGRLSNTGDVVLGVPTGGQTLLEDQSLVGHCVNFLPIRAAFDPAESVKAHFARVAAATRDALEHSDYTLGSLVRDQNTPRTLSRLLLTEVQYILESLPEDLAFGGATAAISPNPKSAVNFDLFFNMIQSRAGLRIDVDYNTDLFDQGTVERWVSHF